jgi:hypothetical protein
MSFLLKVLDFTLQRKALRGVFWVLRFFCFVSGIRIKVIWPGRDMAKTMMPMLRRYRSYSAIGQKIF